MQKDGDVAAQAARYEAVEWLYDGLGGKVIKWTHEQGSTNEDPSVLAWVLSADGVVLAAGRQAHAPGPFAKWLREQADAYERSHPATRVPFVRAQVVAEGDGDARVARAPELDEARAAGRPVLLYVGRTERPGDDKDAARDVKASRKVERGALDSKSVAEAAEGVVLLRLDVGDADHARLARALGIEKVPALLLYPGGESEPEDLVKASAASLAHRLKRLAAAAQPPEDGGGDDGE